MAVIYTLWCMTAICYGLLKGQLETFKKSGSAQVAALEEKVADREKSGNLGLCHPATLTSLSVRTELSFSVCTRRLASEGLALNQDRFTHCPLPFLQTHVCLSNSTATSTEKKRKKKKSSFMNIY